MAWLNLTMPNQTVKNGLKAKKIKLPQMNFFLQKQLIKFSCTYWPLSFCNIFFKKVTKAKVKLLVLLKYLSTIVFIVRTWSTVWKPFQKPIWLNLRLPFSTPSLSQKGPIRVCPSTLLSVHNFSQNWLISFFWNLALC